MKKPYRMLTEKRLIRTHAKYWLTYCLLNYGFNALDGHWPFIPGQVGMVGLAAVVFYALQYLLKKKASNLSLLRTILLALGLFAGAVMILYIGIYGFNNADRFHNPGALFRFGAFLKNAINGYWEVLLAASLYNNYWGRMEEKEQRISSERQVYEQQAALDKARLKELEMEKIQQEISMENWKLECALRNTQLRSHWLQNIFNSVYGRVAYDEELANMILKLIQFIRYLLVNAAQFDGMVMLEKEVNHLRNQIELNALSTTGCQPIIFELDKRPVARQVPPLIFSTLLENSFTHGDQFDPEHPIRVQIESRRDYLLFTCSNKVKNQDKHTESTGMGLLTVERRLQLMCVKDYSLKTETTGLIYTVTLKITY